MKKNITLTVALVVVYLNLFGQQAANVNANASNSFSREFPKAANVLWEAKEKGVSLVRFRMNNESWIAFYNIEGKLLTSGRKVIHAEYLPIEVRKSLDNVLLRHESKYGALAAGNIFEMVSDTGTQYFIPLENNQLKLMVSINSVGASHIQRKEVSKDTTESRSVIARKN